MKGPSVTTADPYSSDHIPLAERHGHSRPLLWLWLAANLPIADYAIGFVPVALGLSVGPAILALALGNILGGLVLAWSAAMGPAAGYPQMFIGRRAFGRVGGYIPAALNWLSTAGWFTVNTILGAFAIQLLGPGLPFWAAAAVLAPGASTPIAALKTAMGGFGVFAVLAVILGATTANVLNLYSNTMSAKVLDVRLQRWHLAIIGGALGFVLALIGYQNFLQNFQNFLIVLDYWIMPWLAVVLLDFYVFAHREPMGFSQAVPVNWNGLIAWLIGLAVSLLFISEQFQVFGLRAHGPFATWFGDADFGYFIGFIVAGVIYLLLNRGTARSAKQ